MILIFYLIFSISLYFRMKNEQRAIELHIIANYNRHKNRDADNFLKMFIFLNSLSSIFDRYRVHFFMNGFIWSWYHNIDLYMKNVYKKTWSSSPTKNWLIFSNLQHVMSKVAADTPQQCDSKTSCSVFLQGFNVFLFCCKLNGISLIFSKWFCYRWIFKLIWKFMLCNQLNARNLYVKKFSYILTNQFVQNCWRLFKRFRLFNIWMHLLEIDWTYRICK